MSSPTISSKKDDAWKQIGNKTWTHKIKKVKKVGLGNYEQLG